MNNDTHASEFEHITIIIEDPLRFKLKLNIGEDAFASLRLKKYALDSMDAASGVVTGVGIAQSSIVASTFFAPSGFLATIGIGAAATPVGWAIAAGVVGAGLSIALGKYFIRGSSGRVKTIPDFINTPLDVLAMGLFDMIGMLSIKLAGIDGTVSESERVVIKTHFVKDWGYSQDFVKKGIQEIEKEAHNYTIKDIAQKLALFKQQNPDCNYAAMSEELIGHLSEIAEADGFLDEREEMAIERIENIFKDAGTFSIKKSVKTSMSVLTNAGEASAKTISAGVSQAGDALKKAGSNVASIIKTTPSNND